MDPSNSEHGERLARIEAKVDFIVDSMAEQKNFNRLFSETREHVSNARFAISLIWGGLVAVGGACTWAISLLIGHKP